MRDTHERNNIYSCVSFSFTQASPPRAYLAPRVLHVPASARLRKAKQKGAQEHLVIFICVEARVNVQA